MDSEPTDCELLEAFARRGDQAAFARIVDRHGGLVYAAALRQVGPALADDVSQAVFFILARKAPQVDGRTLAGWLVKTARLTGLASRRSELRLKQRQHKAALMKHESVDTPQADEAPAWESLAPLLDEALSRLGEKDRNVVTLRYLEGKSVREVAAATSLSEAAAGKRATRAIQALRDYFTRRGVSLSTESLAGALVAHGVIALPTGLAAKLAATAAGGAGAAAGGTLSASAAGIVKGTLPLMAATKVNTAAAVLVASLLVVGGGALIATQLRSSAAPRPAPPALPQAQVIRVVAGATPAPPPPTTAPSLPEALTRYLTPPGSRASFAGRVEGLANPANAEVGVVYLRGTHWLSTDNYQWQPVNADGTFTITAEKYPRARRALAVRSKGHSTTFLRAEFGANESARDIRLRMKPVRPITVVAKDSRGRPVSSLRVEVFEPSIGYGEPRTDDQGRDLVAQQLEVRVDPGNELTVAVPLEPVSLFIGGTGVASHLHTVDPRLSDRFEFQLLAATRIEGMVTRAGTPVAGARVMLNNDTEPLSYVARKTDAKGYFRLTNGVPGTYTIAVGGKTFRVPLAERKPRYVTLDLAAPDEGEGAADVAAAPPVAQPPP